MNIILSVAFSSCTSSVVVEFLLCEVSWTMPSKRNRETGSYDDETGVSKKKRYYQFSSLSIQRPSRRSDLRDKGRSTLTVPRVKMIFFSAAHGGCHWLVRLQKHHETASHRLLQKGNGNTTLTASCQRSSSSSLQRQMTRADATMCNLVAELNLPLSTADSLTTDSTQEKLLQVKWVFCLFVCFKLRCVFVLNMFTMLYKPQMQC